MWPTLLENLCHVSIWLIFTNPLRDMYQYLYLQETEAHDKGLPGPPHKLVTVKDFNTDRSTQKFKHLASMFCPGLGALPLGQLRC